MYELRSTAGKELSAIIANPSMTEATASNPLEGDEIIDTRFGKIAIKRDNPLTFSKGLLGFPDRTQYCLVDIPLPKFKQFKLLQSLEENELSFITLPLDIDNPIIELNDVTGACAELGFNIADTLLLLIVSVHRELKQIKLSGNARAPIFVHSKKKRAEQYVLHNSKYLVRHTLME